MGAGPDQAFMLRDMLVPFNLAVNDLALGLTGNPARAMPQDTIMALLSPTIPGTFFAGFTVVAAAVAGMFDASRMVRDMAGASRFIQLVISVIVVWNPFVIERLLQGQWTVAIAAMVLPTVAYYSAIGVRSAQFVFMAFAGLTPTGLILATITALSFERGWRRRVVTLIVAAGLSTPWTLVTLFNSTTSTADPASAAAFAAGPDHALGTVVSVLSFGGIWNAGAVPASIGVGSGICGLAMFLFALTGFRELWRVYRPVAMVFVGAFALPILLATPPGLSFMSWAVHMIPGAGLFRDSQKLVSLALPGMILLLATALRQLQRCVSRERVKQVVPFLLLGLIIGTVPAFPRDIAPAAPVDLSPAWTRMANTVAGGPSGRMLLLPPGNYRLRDDGQPTLTPALKMLPGYQIDPQYLVVDGVVLDGDPEAMELLRDTVNGNDRLAESGVGWVVVDRGSIPISGDFRKMDDLLTEHKRLMNIDGIELYRVANPKAIPGEYSPAPMWVGMGIYWGISMGALWVMIWAGLRTMWFISRKRGQ